MPHSLPEDTYGQSYLQESLFTPARDPHTAAEAASADIAEQPPGWRVQQLTQQLTAATCKHAELQTHCQAFQQQFESPQSQLTQPQTHCHQLQEQLCPPPPPTPAPAVPDLTSDLSRVQRHLDAAAANKLQLQTQNASLQQKLSSAQVHFSLLQQQQQQMLDCTFFGMNWTAPNGQTGMGEADSSGANALKAQLGGAQMQMQADMQAVQSVLVLRTHQAEALQAKIELLRPMAHVTHSEWVSGMPLFYPSHVLSKSLDNLPLKAGSQPLTEKE
ncbi:TPA: hypothetical protein ACH3X1_002622 [Trebouxia sp. C0004]